MLGNPYLQQPRGATTSSYGSCTEGRALTIPHFGLSGTVGSQDHRYKGLGRDAQYSSADRYTAPRSLQLPCIEKYHWPHSQDLGAPIIEVMAP